MAMENEKSILNELDILNENAEEVFDFDELEAKLQGQLEEELADLEFLQEEREKISSPDALGETIKNVVWEQFINQIATTAGEDFIAENHGLHLDLRKEAHIQTADNFAKGKIATHNYMSKEQIEKNYDRYKNTPHQEFRKKYVQPGMDKTLKRAGQLKNEGVDTVKDIYTGRQITTQKKLPNGVENPKAAQREHVKPSAELYKDPSLQMANNDKELAAIINNPENLQGYTTAERNNRKNDYSPEEMSAQDKNKHWEKANERAEKYIDKERKKGEERLKQEGLKTQKEEAFRIGGKALRVIIMQLLAELVKEIIAKLVKWFKIAERKLDTLLAALKEAALSFVIKLKTHLKNSAEMLVTTVATAVWGPIVNTIKKVWTMLKQSWRSLKEAIDYIKNPDNKGKSVGILMLEVGKIIMAGLSATGAIVLGEVIEKALLTIPGVGQTVFAFEIPLIGNLANILGVFLGAVVAGIIGAIVINLLQKKLEEVKKSEIVAEQIDRGNEILNLQRRIKAINEAKLEYTEIRTADVIKKRHAKAADIVQGALENIAKNCEEDETFSAIQDDIDKLFEELEGEEP